MSSGWHFGLNTTMPQTVKKTFSIRYKILILMTLIPVASLGAYLLLALQVFKDDKIAYVFDSSSNLSASLATQVKTQLNATLVSARTLFQDFLNEEKFSQVSEKIFFGDAHLESLSVFKQEGSGPFAKLSHLEKKTGQWDSYWKSWGPQALVLVQQASETGRLIKIRTKDDRLLILEPVKDPSSSRRFVFAMVYLASDLKEVFTETGTSSASLIDSSGFIFFARSGLEGNYLSEQVPLNFLKDKARTQGAEQVADRNQKEILLSFAKVGFGDLYVVTLVEQSKALGAAQVLMKKSLIFFVILVSFTAILSLLASRTLTEALELLFRATQRVSEGKFDLKVRVKSNDEIGALANNFNLMSDEVSRLLSQTAEKARMENELQTAKTVQETLFPETISRIGSLSISGFYEPASECGGDWWHYCQIGEKVFLWIGDATGHGAPAALITSAAKSASAIIERLDVSPCQALELLNRCIYDVSKGKIMMTFFIASFDLKTHKLVYANSSHEAPLMIKKSDGPVKKKDLIPLNEVNGPRLGQARETTYEESETILSPGDTLFFYTDGLQDIKNKKDEAWGEREFIKGLVKSVDGQPEPQVATTKLVQNFQAYRQGTQLIDDVTFFIVKNME